MSPTPALRARAAQSERSSWRRSYPETGTASRVTTLCSSARRGDASAYPGCSTVPERYGFTGDGDTPDFVSDGAGELTGWDLPLPGGATAERRGSSAVWSYPNIHGDIVATTDVAGQLAGSTLPVYDPFGVLMNDQAQPLATSIAGAVAIATITWTVTRARHPSAFVECLTPIAKDVLSQDVRVLVEDERDQRADRWVIERRTPEEAGTRTAAITHFCSGSIVLAVRLISAFIDRTTCRETKEGPFGIGRSLKRRGGDDRQVQVSRWWRR